ncbi:MAG: CdaR family protein, partial [Oscillospiraceae bacterium]|nr:CdaR family protein [Oscillospiraceae bacterium]
MTTLRKAISKVISNSVVVKVLCFICAALLWFLVNPVGSKVITVPLNIVNRNLLDSKDIAIRNNFNDKIMVEVRGRQDKIDEITADDIVAYLDFARISSVGDRSLPIDTPVIIKDGVSIKSYSPMSVELILQQMTRKSLIATIEYVNVPDGYVVLDSSDKYRNIEVFDAESIVGIIDRVVCEVDLTGFYKDQLLLAQDCVAYNANGESLNSALTRSLRVNVDLKLAKVVPLTVMEMGTLGDGIVGEVGEPLTNGVRVTGTSGDSWEKLAFMETLYVWVDLGDIKETGTIDGRIEIDESLRLYDSVGTVRVAVTAQTYVV